MAPRKIIHIDADAFYASVEQRDDPALRGRPVVVGGSPDGRGVVCAASYEARRSGVHSAIPCSQARRLCPAAIFVRPDFTRYREASGRMHAIFADYTDLVQPLSLDEAYLDVTADRAGLGSATATAREIRRRIREDLRLTVSAGVAPNKLVAKIASDYDKPDGLTVVPPDRVLEFLGPLPIRRVPGVGPVTDERLRGKGIEHIGDLLDLADTAFDELFGSHADWFRQVARGEDDRPVRRPGKAKQVSVEDTVGEDLVDLGACQRMLATLVDRLWDRLTRSERFGRTVTVKVKYGDFSQVTRSRTKADPYETWRDVEAVRAAALDLLDDTEAGERPVRLLGVGISGFDNEGAQQLNLFGPETD